VTESTSYQKLLKRKAKRLQGAYQREIIFKAIADNQGEQNDYTQ